LSNIWAVSTASAVAREIYKKPRFNSLDTHRYAKWCRYLHYLRGIPALSLHWDSVLAIQEFFSRKFFGGQGSRH
jgi:hypothetical protein